MKKRKLLIVSHIAVPVFIIFILAYTAYTTSDDLFANGLILNSLILYYPLVFLLQGSASSLLKSNVFLSLGISIAMFIIVLLTLLNSSAIIYIFVYLIVGFIGYGMTLLIQNLISTRDS